MTTYYITETNYVGPNRDQYPDENYFDIQTEAPTTNGSHEVRTEGWLGTTNDWASYAHGAFDTFEEAEAALKAMLADEGYRTVDPEEEPWDLEGNGIEVRYKHGAFEQLGPTATAEVLYADAEVDDLTGDETDEQVEALADEIEVGMKINHRLQVDQTALIRALYAQRDEKRDEAGDD